LGVSTAMSGVAMSGCVITHEYVRFTEGIVYIGIRYSIRVG
jgi:hypothetical protein